MVLIELFLYYYYYYYNFYTTFSIIPSFYIVNQLLQGAKENGNPETFDYNLNIFQPILTKSVSYFP